MQYLGDFAEDATVYIPFNTFSSDDPQASVTITNLVDADIKVHKDGSVTQIVTDGATIAIDFDSITGNHLITIDTSAHADYSVGSDYLVRIEGTTVDAGTINAFIGSFSIENRFNEVDVTKWLGTAAATPTTAGVPEVDVTFVSGTAQTANDNGADLNALVSANIAVNTTITSVTSQTELVLNGGIPTDDTYNELTVLIIDAGTPTEMSVNTITDYVGATTTIHLKDTPEFTVATSDIVIILTNNSLKATTKNTRLDITANGNAGIDWNNIDNPTTAVDLSGTDIQLVDTATDVTTKTGYSLAATGLDAIASTATGMVEIAKAIWDRVLTGATHNINNSAGKRLRQVDAAFEVHSGTAQAGSTTTITLDTGASATNDIYRGDRIIIIAGTGVGEHDICIAYNGTTKVATVAETWVITPDATSEFILVPASVDIETWQHSVVTSSAGGLPDVNANEVGDTAQTGGDLTALIGTAQLDLDKITGSDGVTLATAQANYAPSVAGDSMALTAGAVDDIYDEDLTAHQTALSAGRAITLGGVPIAETTATGTPTTTEIILAAGSAIDDAYKDQTVKILSGVAVGQARICSGYTGSTKTLAFDEPYETACSSGDAVAVAIDHVHPVSQIADGVWDEATSGHTTAGTTGKAITDTLADTNELQTDDVPTLIAAVQTEVDKIGTPADTDVSTDIANIKTDTTAILADTVSLGITKNATFSNLEFLMVDATDFATPETGLTVTGQMSIDGAAFANINGTIAEVGSGIYQVDLTAADTNGDVITYKFASAGAADRFVTIKTRA